MERQELREEAERIARKESGNKKTIFSDDEAQLLDGMDLDF